MKKVKENKKIKNTKVSTYNGIDFKSSLEMFTYKELMKRFNQANYEEFTATFSTGQKFNNILYYKSTKNYKTKQKSFKRVNKYEKLTYTPDFNVKIGNCWFIFDVKGFQNDSYPIKKKLFFNYLETNYSDCTIFFFEPSNQKQVIECLNIIDSINENNSNILKYTTNELKEECYDKIRYFIFDSDYKGAIIEIDKTLKKAQIKLKTLQIDCSLLTEKLTILKELLKDYAKI